MLNEKGAAKAQNIGIRVQPGCASSSCPDLSLSDVSVARRDVDYGMAGCCVDLASKGYLDGFLIVPPVCRGALYVGFRMRCAVVLVSMLSLVACVSKPTGRARQNNEGMK